MATDLIREWQRKDINGAIISSIELLERLIASGAGYSAKWLKSITIYAPSLRITEQAKHWGWSDVKILPGMSDEQVIDYFKD